MLMMVMKIQISSATVWCLLLDDESAHEEEAVEETDMRLLELINDILHTIQDILNELLYL